MKKKEKKNLTSAIGDAKSQQKCNYFVSHREVKEFNYNILFKNVREFPGGLPHG